MRSERLISSRAARVLRVLCTYSGTSLICTILDMFQPYKHVRYMSKKPHFERLRREPQLLKAHELRPLQIAEEG